MNIYPSKQYIYVVKLFPYFATFTVKLYHTRRILGSPRVQNFGSLIKAQYKKLPNKQLLFSNFASFTVNGWTSNQLGTTFFRIT
jgi:hypothetical protein